MDSLSNDNGRCVPVFGSVEIPNAVVTCLEDVDETIEVEIVISFFLSFFFFLFYFLSFSFFNLD